jgi:putative RNA 2'-phosphotransferase
MISEQENTRISKFLSLVLRHQPQYIGIELDAQGWTDAHTLIGKAQKKGIALNMDVLKHVVETNAKRRYSFNEEGTKIRANQGHSVEVDLAYKPQVPPAVLYHGTGSQSVNSILTSGLSKMKRHHVHLSSELQTALTVGQRHGKPVVLRIASLEMSKQGYEFFISANGVWLTDHVPAKYITLNDKSLYQE